MPSAIWQIELIAEEARKCRSGRGRQRITTAAAATPTRTDCFGADTSPVRVPAFGQVGDGTIFVASSDLVEHPLTRA